MLKLFTWDEIDNEVRERDPHEVFQCNAEGGWLTEGWTGDGLVEVRRTDRHVALECWALDEAQAIRLFSRVGEFKLMWNR